MEYFYLIYPIIFQYSVLIITKCVIRTDAEFKQQREYKTKNIADFSEKMRLTNWQTVLNTIEPQLAYSSFQNIFMQCYESCFPIKENAVSIQK